MEEFPSNTKSSKVPARPEKAEQVTTGRVIVKKKGLGSRFKDAFTGEDGRGVMEHVLWDVLVPAAKDMVVDAGNEALNRAMYGDSRAPSRRGGPINYGRVSSNIASRVNYNRSALVTDPRERAKEQRKAPIPTTGRVDFQEIILASRIEADEVIQRLNDLINGYEQATIADLFDLVGVTGEYTDEKFGWVNLDGARPRKVRDGYLLDLPNPIQLD